MKGIGYCPTCKVVTTQEGEAVSLTCTEYCSVCQHLTLHEYDSSAGSITCLECKCKPLQSVKLPESSGNKFHAQRTWSELCQRWFASKAEARRGEELCLMEKAGAISNLQYQVKFTLCESPKISITVDFVYADTPDIIIVEDVKGVLTRDFRTKLAWIKEKFGIEVKLVKGAK